MTDHPIDPYDIDPTAETAAETAPDKPKRHPRPGANPVGRPAVILDGWDAELGTWDHHSQVGQILAAIRRGAHRNAAMQRAGLARTTGDVWMARGREHRPVDDYDRTAIPPEHLPYVQFVCAIEQRDSAFEVELTRWVYEACEEDKKFALTVLGRKYPHWREQSRLDIGPAEETDPLHGLRDHPGVTARLAALAHELEDARFNPAAITQAATEDTN